LLGCGSNNDEDWGHGIRVHTFHSVGGDGGTVEIYDNIIIEARRYGISGTSDADAYLYRNIIAEPGIGEFDGASMVEGTGNNANSYNVDADAFCFATWSDDSDYSNDDFSLCCSYPYIGGCFLNANTGITLEGVQINQ